jgi:hypothetical protein
MRGAAARAQRATTPEHYRRALRHGRAAAAHAPQPAPRGEIAGIVAALPNLTHDALGLQVGGGRIRPRAEQAWLVRAGARAAAALWRAERALAAESGADPQTLELARDRLGWIAAADQDENAVVAGMEACAQWIAEALTAPTSDAAAESLSLATGELFAIALLAWTPQDAGRLSRASARPAQGQAGAWRREPHRRRRA